jgi:hypothetical protein
MKSLLLLKCAAAQSREKIRLNPIHLLEQKQSSNSSKPTPCNLPNLFRAHNNFKIPKFLEVQQTQSHGVIVMTPKKLMVFCNLNSTPKETSHFLLQENDFRQRTIGFFKTKQRGKSKRSLTRIASDD